MRYEGLTLSARRMMQRMRGFRNDEIYGSGHEDFEEVIKYEILELGNTDIFDTIELLYPTTLKLPEDTYQAIDTIINFFKKVYRTNKLYVKWLATKDSVYEYYGGNPTCYVINPNALILSDLGKEGVLFISDKPFLPESEINKVRFI